jgi:hypothetical protein
MVKEQIKLNRNGQNVKNIPLSLEVYTIGIDASI